MKLNLSINCLIAFLIVSQLICGTWSLVSASAVGVGEEGIFRSETNLKFLSENFNVETKLKRNGGGMYNLFRKGFEKRGNLNTFLHESNPFLMNEPLLSSTFHQRNVQQDFFSVLLKVKDIIKFKTENSELSIQPLAKNVISTRMSMETIQKLMNKDYIEWIGQVDPIFKFDMQDFMSNEQELVELLVQFHESGISEEMKQLIQVLETQFGVSLIRKEKTIMILTVPRRFSLGVSYEISKDSAVIWIEPKQEITIFNKFSKSIIDDGSEKRESVNFGGLTGEGETVTVVDGSFDTNSCFFTDPNVPIPIFKTIEEGMKLTTEQVNTHRKVKAYYALVDNRTVDSDHGSHVAGSVAGNFLSSTNSQSSLADYSGVAPDAKMVFVQIGCVSPLCISESGETISSKAGGLNPPTDPSNIFKFSTEIAKSKIQTNSWGGGSAYSYYASKTDQYLFENKDTVSLFAAGNSGAKGFYTLSAQSQAKNIITVGASHNSFDARAVQYGNLSNPTLPNVREWITASLKCGSIGNKYQTECDYFTNSSNVVDACDESGYCAKGKMAIAYGNCGCAIDGVGYYFCARCIYPLLARNDIQPNSVTSFSSRGPSKDGRIKPDILAPGDVVISARSFPTLDDIGTKCSQRTTNMQDHITSKRGTSMATPTMAGLTAIVRQYFRDGYYVDGVKNTKIGFNPSSALVKATMINSAVDLTHVSEDYKLVENFVPRIWNYTRFQGFGKVQVGNVLQFGKTERKLWIARKEYIQNIAQLSHNVETEFDDPVISSSADEHLYYIAPTNANLPMKNVKITLVWTDYPSSPVSRLNIVNNLDLEVNIYRDVIYGNSQLKGLSQDNMVRDTINNVEQVWIDSIDHGVVIRIYAEYLFVPQSYSLVVSGDNVQMHLLKE